MDRQIRLLAFTPATVAGSGICAILSSELQFDLIQISTIEFRELLTYYRKYTPCLLLVTVSPTTPDLLHTIKHLQAEEPLLRLILIANSYEQEHMDLLRELSAGALVLTSDTPTALCAAVHEVSVGSSWFTAAAVNHYYKDKQNAVTRNRHSDLIHSLTRREHQVLSLLAHGLSNAQISQKLYVSERTIRFHVHNIYEKLNFTSRGEAIAWAIQSGAHNQ